MPNKDELLVRLMTHHCGDNWHHRNPKELDAQLIVEALWPLNDLFRVESTRVRALPYQAELEPQADKAIERYAQAGSWRAVSLEVKRVLMERHTQALAWFMAEGVAAPWKTYMSVPDNLPPSVLPAAIMLYLIHGMKLPHPVGGR